QVCGVLPLDREVGKNGAVVRVLRQAVVEQRLDRPLGCAGDGVRIERRDVGAADAEGDRSVLRAARRADGAWGRIAVLDERECDERDNGCRGEDRQDPVPSVEAVHVFVLLVGNSLTGERAATLVSGPTRVSRVEPSQARVTPRAMLITSISETKVRANPA